jgi:predicted kinase
MEAVILIGIQASGKTTFYRERFFETHIRISLDMLHTRHREQVLLQACLRSQQSFVIDNTNVRAAERARYIIPATEAGFRVVGYFFQTDLRSAIARNGRRQDKQAIPVKGVIGTFKRIELPSVSEGFHQLYLARLDAQNRFRVELFPAPSEILSEGTQGQ